MLVLSSLARSPALSDLRFSSFFFCDRRDNNNKSSARKMARKRRAKTVVNAILAVVQYPFLGLDEAESSPLGVSLFGVGAMTDKAGRFCGGGEKGKRTSIIVLYRLKYL